MRTATLILFFFILLTSPFPAAAAGVGIPALQESGEEGITIVRGEGRRGGTLSGDTTEMEQPIMTIGYTPPKYNDNPLLGNRYQKTHRVIARSGAPQATVGDVLLVIVVVIAVIAAVVLCLFLLSAMIEDILN